MAGQLQRRQHAPWTLEEELAGGPLPTQFGRVVAELGIRVIHARSPQAKGRVERLFGTLQDRLCAELRLAGLHAGSALDEANHVLWAYLPRFNARFAVSPAEPTTAYRRVTDVLPRSVSLDVALDQVCCFKYTRVVGLDHTVRFGNQRLQLAPGPPGAHRRSFAKARVEVHERLDGSLAVYHDGHRLATTPAPAEAPVLRARHRSSSLPVAPPAAPPAALAGPVATAPRPAPPSAPPPATTWRVGDPQPATHPWRRPPVEDPDALAQPRRTRWLQR